MDYDSLSFVLATEKRAKVMRSLKFPTTPLRISKQTGITKEHVSRLLKMLTDLGLVECKTPRKIKGRIYELTDKGKEILEQLDKRDQTSQ